MFGNVSELIQYFLASDSGIDHFKALIWLQRHATPKEWQEFMLSTDCGARGSAEFQRNLGSLSQSILRHGSRLSNHERVLDSDQLSHYRGPDKAGRMVVAFCGKAHMLFGPVARVLQYFPADQFEVLVLRDSMGLGFTRGLEGHSQSFVEMIDRIREQFLTDKGQEVVCLGTSGGGGPAIVAAVLLSAKAGVALAGRSPKSSTLYGKSEGAAAMEGILRAAAATNRGTLHAVYPAKNPDDAAKAHYLSELAPVTLWPIAGISNHNVLHELDLRGELADVLKSTGLSS